MKRPILLTLPLLLLAPALLGGPPEMSSHDAAIVELLRLTKAEEALLGAVRTAIDAQAQASPTLLPYRDVLIEWAGRYLTWDAMLPEMLRIYRESFTEAEIRKLIAFYRTPTGQKAVERIPELMQKGAAVGLAIAQAHQAELEQMIAQRQRELEAAQPRPEAPQEKPAGAGEPKAPR